MAESRHARLLGPTLIAMSAVPLTQVYLAGTLWLVAGLSIVRTHNRWVLGWPVVVTLMGWFAIVGGLFRMFAPEAALRGTPSPSLLLALQLLLLAIGLFLTFKALVQRRG